jgi:hypothetical protein
MQRDGEIEGQNDRETELQRDTYRQRRVIGSRWTLTKQPKNI